ncbi:TolB family protein [Streptomyces sp. NPDC057654]|uniref:TolB family protein n=1 Tax=Streptomyces sp. NPDC057654 TaxID=3346196 RepID=UPI003685B7B0
MSIAVRAAIGTALAGALTAAALPAATAADTGAAHRPRTVRASVAADGAQADAASGGGVISANGRYVAFTSRATNLTPDTGSPFPDTFVKDLRTGTVTFVRDGLYGLRMSADANCVGFNDYGAHDIQGIVHDMKTGKRDLLGQARGGSTLTSLSADCRYAAYTDKPHHPADPRAVYVRDRQTGENIKASHDATPEQFDMTDGSISGDGKTIAYQTHRRLGEGPDTDDIVVKDLVTGEREQIDGSHDVAPASLVQLSSNARTVAYNVGPDAYVRDLRTGRTVHLPGVQARALSPDGRQVLYADSASKLHLRDLRSGDDRTVVDAPASAGPGSLSAHAKSLAFGSGADDLVPGDTNGFADVFVRRLR